MTNRNPEIRMCKCVKRPEPEVIKEADGSTWHVVCGGYIKPKAKRASKKER